MKIDIQITPHAIKPGPGLEAEFPGVIGAIAEFSGVVRDQENGANIAALEYEAFSPMAENEMHRILSSLAESFPCLAVRVIHRVGIIPAGETAIQVLVLARHRDAAFATLAEFMNRLKRDVPIWKRRALPVSGPVTPLIVRPPRSPAHDPFSTAKSASGSPSPKSSLSLDDALTEIHSHVATLDAIAMPLAEAARHILLEAVFACEDLPTSDRSTRDGYAILRDDPSPAFSVVDTLHAADWKPRQLKTGEAVRVATGAALPCENLQVVMQEDIEKEGGQIKITRRDVAANVRNRGEEMRAGQMVLPKGTLLNAGALALMATVGCTRPRVSPRLKVIHFTTGDELLSPDEKPLPGQIRDSNSILIRGWLQSYCCDLWQQHLPEDFERAKTTIANQISKIQNADLLLVSGGASVGEKDFTRELLGFLGFQMVFERLNLRPGGPLIFGVADRRVAFGLPGNPLAHVACLHVFVAVALARLTGAKPPAFMPGTLASALTDAACPRETLWPACCQMTAGKLELTPLRWRSSGDVTCLSATNALIRVPANTPDLPAGAEVQFLSIPF